MSQVLLKGIVVPELGMLAQRTDGSGKIGQRRQILVEAVLVVGQRHVDIADFLQNMRELIDMDVKPTGQHMKVLPRRCMVVIIKDSAQIEVVFILLLAPTEDCIHNSRSENTHVTGELLHLLRRKAQTLLIVDIDTQFSQLQA